jgi:positive regulator of sigma E activity
MTQTLLTRVGELVVDDSGQLVFRLNHAQCVACSASCHRRRVRELVVPSDSQVEDAGFPVVLTWSRREMSKTSLRVYGPPVVGLLLAVGVSTIARFPDSMASLLVLAGLVGGMLVARLVAENWQPDRVPEISLQPFKHDE